MSLLERVTSPADLKSLTSEELDQLAAEIRAFLITQVSRTGGHLGPNLGVVELTIALHRVFDSPNDPIIFDTGHQSYVHKILTGRQGAFDTLRQGGGLSGYPSRAESPHDWVENSHATTSLSWAEGMAKGFRLRGEDRTVVAVVGDGALTGGMAWEALNNIALQDDLRLVVVVNDNGRSYTPTVGGLAARLSAVRTDHRYEKTLRLIKRLVNNFPVFGRLAYAMMHAFKMGVKDALAPQNLFSDLSIKYLGPVDGHDEAALEIALQQARNFGGPVMVHVLTHKGRGFRAAEEHELDRFHAVGQIDEETGEPLSGSARSWTDAFGEELVRIAANDDRIVALTAAMLHPTGLDRFAKLFPDRVFDVGIAEQHAVTSAAGLATAGLHPVVAIYATFLNRAFDQVVMDVALHKLGVTFVLDRAGVTGPDGASHHGMWDLSLMGLVPGLRLAAPRDEERLGRVLREAVGVDDAPTVIRFSRDRLPEPIPALDSIGGMDVLLADPSARVLIIGYGQLMGTALDVSRRLSHQGIGVTLIDPIWALPVNPILVGQAIEHDLVVTIEDGGLAGGLGSRVAQELRLNGVTTPVREFGLPQRFLDHGSRDAILNEVGLSAQEIARVITERVSAQESQPVVPG